MYPDLRAAGAEVVVFSAEKNEVSRDLAAKQSITYPIVHDVDLAIAKAFGIAFVLPDDVKGVYQGFGIDLPKNSGMTTWELPMPARFVIDSSGIVRAADVDPDYTHRPEATATLAVIKSL